MNFDQEKTGEGRNTLPVNGNRPLNGLGAIVGDTAAQGFDSLQATQQAAACRTQFYISFRVKKFRLQAA